MKTDPETLSDPAARHKFLQHANAVEMMAAHEVFHKKVMDAEVVTDSIGDAAGIDLGDPGRGDVVCFRASRTTEYVQEHRVLAPLITVKLLRQGGGYAILDAKAVSKLLAWMHHMVGSGECGETNA